MPLETEVGQKLISEDGINGLPVRLADISGAYDDGSPDGAVRSKLVLGELVPLPLFPDKTSFETSGGSAISQQTLLVANPDRTGSGIYVTVPADATRAGGGARIWFTFAGRALGLRWQRSNTTPNFSVRIDGVAYGVQGYNTQLLLENIAITNDEAHWLVADDLHDGEHVAEIIVAASASTARNITFYGASVERRAGYAAPRRFLMASMRGAVPTTPATFLNGSVPAAATLRGIRQLIYTNTSAAAVVVTVYDGGTAAADIVWSKSIAAGDTQTLDFGDCISTLLLNGYVTHGASAAGVYYTAIGGA